MPRKKLSKKPAVAKKSPKSPKAAKPGKSATVNYLAPLTELTNCIKNDYSQLKQLFETTPAKINKAIAAINGKLKKSVANQAKTHAALAKLKSKITTKPALKSTQDRAKLEKALAENKAEKFALDAELKQLTEQLRECRKMQQKYTAAEKAIKKIKTNIAKQATAKPKQSAKKKKLKPKQIKTSEAVSEPETTLSEI